MPNNNGVITRRDIITDEALFFGDTYAKELQKAIDKNKELAQSAKDLNALSKSFKTVKTNSDYVKNVEKEIAVTQKSQTVWKEQIQIENNLISTKKRVELASEGTHLALIKEREILKEQNKVLRQQAREQLGLSGAYDRLKNKRDQAQRTLQNLLSAERANTNEVKRAQREFDILNAKLNKVDNASKRYTNNIGNYQSAFRGLGGIARDLIGAFGIVGGVTLFANVVKNIYSISKELNALRTALGAVTETQENFAAQQSFLKRIASDYGLEIRSLTRTYTQFYAAAKDKLSGDQIQTIFEKIAKSASLMGLTVEQQEGAFLALQQMLSKGTVQAEEIRGQLGERLPGAFSILAKSMNVTEEELNDLLKAGKVAAKDVLPAFAEELERAYGADKVDKITTMVSEQNRLTNSWVDFVDELTKGESTLSKVFITVMGEATETLEYYTKLMKEQKTFSVNQRVLSAYNVEMEKFQKQTYLSADALKEMAGVELTHLKDQLHDLDQARESLQRRLPQSGKYEVFNFFTGQESFNKLKKELDDNNKTSSQLIGRIQFLNELLSGNVDLEKLNEERLKKSNAARSRTVEVIKEEIKLQNDLLEQTTSRNDAKPIQNRIKALEKEIEAILGVKDANTDRYEKMKKQADDEYQLGQFRLQQEIDLSKEYFENEKLSTNERLDYLYNASQVEIAKAQETAEFKLKEFSRYDDAVRDLSDEQIRTLITGGTIREKLYDKEKLYIEQLQAEITNIFKKEQEDRDKLVAFDVNKFEEGINGKILGQNTDQNYELEQENNRFAALSAAERRREKNVEEHEKNIYEIKKRYAIDALNVQIKAIEDLLAMQDTLPDNEQINAKERAQIENNLSQYKKQVSEIELEDFQSKSGKKVMTAEEEAEKIKNLQKDLYSALKDFANTLFDARIQKLDDEIYEMEQFYQRQMDLAGEDERQRASIEEEAERKRQELERKKRKEQHKQAVYNKAVKASEIITETSLAIISALAQVPKFDFGISAAAISGLYASIGAVQLANVLATPVPKYAKGRKNGKEEIAWTGDGGRHEVVEHKDGGYYITDKKPMLTHLLQGDRVYSSLDEFERLKKASIMASLNMQGRKVKEYQAKQIFESTYSKELVKEMILTRKAIEKNKPVVHVQTPTMDIPHKLWTGNNIKWK